MKLKNRGNLYLVVRSVGRVVVGGFSEAEEAYDHASACEQEWFDTTGEGVNFNVELTTYYGK